MEVVRFTLDPEETGVILVALATLMGMQANGRAKAHFASEEERDYAAASDRVIRKICVQAGLPEGTLAELIVKTRREMMQVIK